MDLLGRPRLYLIEKEREIYVEAQDLWITLPKRGDIEGKIGLCRDKVVAF